MPEKGIDNSSKRTAKKSSPSRLVSLSPEVQGIIASFVSITCVHSLRVGDLKANEDSDQLLRPTDLNALSRTCKTLRGTSLPKLYRRVDIRIPAEYYQVNALENLLLGSGEGLKSTRQLRILPQQGPLHDGGSSNLDDDENVKPAHDDQHGDSASSFVFNILIRQVIAKIPINHLEMFEYVFYFSLQR